MFRYDTCIPFYSAIGPMMSMIPTISVKMSTCINPVLYIALNPQVREYDNTYFSDKYI